MMGMLLGDVCQMNRDRQKNERAVNRSSQGVAVLRSVVDGL